MIATLVAGICLSLTAPQPQANLYTGLGPHVRSVKTASPVAQRYFNQGLSFLFAFNHDEAIRSFTAATVADPKCAMAWWGIATANGPHINNPVVDEDHAKAAWAALQKARANVSRRDGIEWALIDAAGKRFANPQPADRSKLDKAYADAMRKVYRQFQKDADVGAMFAESMMDLRPWDLWKKNGDPQPGTKEIVATLQKVLRTNPKHPLGLHLYIHAVEASPTPELAIEAADRLRDLEPGLGHMVHMPSHIDVRVGTWQKAIDANARAIVADNNYAKRQPEIGFYRLYMAHNHHMLAFAGMMTGQSKKSVESIDAMVAQVPDEVKQAAAPFIDGFFAMPFEVRVRFGMWNEVLELPDLPEYFPLSRALRHAARGVAYAALGDLSFARAEQSLFQAARKRVPEGATFGNNTAADVMTVASHLLNGEILIAEGKLIGAAAELRKGVKAEDQLRYDEPPDWIQPVRHTLGALLLKMGAHDEAINVYRADLKKLPNNGWSLYGMSEALSAKGRASEAARYAAQFKKVWAKADTKISSSCCCLPGK